MIGILGGIGSGKSTVAAEFGKLGCEVINADEIAHRKLEEPGIKKQIVEYFGGAVLGIDGKIDHHKLAKAAFAEAGKIEKLNSIVHPAVLAQVENKIEAIQQAGQAKAIVLDVPLLVETGWDKRCDALVFVRYDEEKREKRVQKNALLSPKELKKREKFQISLDIKATMTENTVDNNSDLSALARQVAEIFPKIVRNV
ncbi:MAG: dephospho-CoA kinase [Phycisphaerae bacterium]|jgi:dephospho-CoA kinase